MQKLIFSILSSFISISSAYAFNTSFMTYSPAYYFTEEDWNISQATLKNALNQAGDNVKVTWRNPKTKAGGYFIPSNTSVQNGTRCRTLRIFSEAHGFTGKSVYRFCYLKGEWKIVQ